MIRRLFLFFTLCLLVIPASADDPAEANKLLVEAVKLIQAANTNQTAAEQLPLLESALAKLNQIVDDHPSSDLAVKLITGQQIGTLSLAGVAQEVEETRRTACLESLSYPCLIEAALAIGESNPAWTFSLISRAHTAAGQSQAAAEALSKALAAVDKGPQSAAQHGFIHALAGNVQEAMTVIQTTEDTDVREFMLLMVVWRHALMGNIRDALATPEIATNTPLRALVPAQIAKIQSMMGNLRELSTDRDFNEAFSKALSDAETIAHPFRRDQVLAEIATTQSLMGNSRYQDTKEMIEDANVKRGVANYGQLLDEKAFRDASRAAEAISEPLPRAQMLTIIAAAQGRAGEAQGARSTVELITDNELRVWALTVLATVHAQGADLTR